MSLLSVVFFDVGNVLVERLQHPFEVIARELDREPAEIAAAHERRQRRPEIGRLYPGLGMRPMIMLAGIWIFNLNPDALLRPTESPG